MIDPHESKAQPFATGTARNVTLRCANGHAWQSVEARSTSFAPAWKSALSNPGGLFSLLTTYRPGACPECHGEPVAIEGRGSE